MNKFENNIAYLFLVFAAFLWGGNIIAAKVASNISLEPIKLSFYRSIISIIILFPFAINELVKNKYLYLEYWKIILFLSLLSGGIFNVFMNIALTSSTVISSSLMPAFAPSIIIILSFFIYNIRIFKIQILGVIISFIGFINIIIKGNLYNLSKLDFVIGDLWMLSAVFSWSIY